MSTIITTPKARIHPDDRAFIYERDENRCLVCLDDNSDLLTIDHIVPLAKGGRNHVSNYQTLCRKCNVKKGSEYIDYRWHDEPPLEISPTTFALPKINRIPKKVYNKRWARDIADCTPPKAKEYKYGYSGSEVSYRYPEIHTAVACATPKYYDKTNFHVIESSDWP